MLGRPFDLSDERRLTIAVAVPHADLLADRSSLRRWILILTLAALAAAMARAAVVARRFSQPIEALVEHSDRISRGDLEPPRPIPTPLAEVHRLTGAHERMRRGLKTLMKLEGDLQLARQIQQKTFPGDLPRLAGFDLVAWSRPADETGGDSYDVIGLDANGLITEGDAERAVLLLADATGHGIGPSAVGHPTASDATHGGASRPRRRRQRLARGRPAHQRAALRRPSQQPLHHRLAGDARRRSRHPDHLQRRPGAAPALPRGTSL